MNKTQAGRMFTLAHFLETQVPESRFDMEYWFSLARHDNPEDLMSHDCGPSACALGWAAAIWPKHWRWGSCWEPEPRTHDLGESPIENACPFFGVDLQEALVLFGSRQRTPQEEAAMLRRVADDYGWEEA